MSDVNFDLLDSSIDELADLESFSPIPAGTHRVSINWEKKEINEKPGVVLNMKVLETIEMSNSSEEPPEIGKESDILFLLKKDDGTPNTMGQGQLKEIVVALREVHGGDTIAQTMENSDGAEVVVTLKIRASKNDPDQKFNSIKTMIADV
jgi:hypothetical protein